MIREMIHKEAFVPKYSVFAISEFRQLRYHLLQEMITHVKNFPVISTLYFNWTEVLIKCVNFVDGGSSPNMLQAVNVPIVSLATCSAVYYGGVLKNIHLCAGDTGISTCYVSKYTRI